MKTTITGIYLIALSAVVVAQPLSNSGNWEFVATSDGSRVHWRNAPIDGPQPDPPSYFDDFARKRPYLVDTFGIHAVVLPQKTFLPDHPLGLRGTVVLWGNGAHHPGIPANSLDPYSVSYTPYLLQNPAAPGDRAALGFIGYSVDPDVTSNSVNNIDGANLFAAGVALMADGALFTAGGSCRIHKNDFDGLSACYRFDASRWRNDATLAVHAGWSLPLGIYSLDGSVGARIGMAFPRWAPSVLLLHDKRMLIVGGTRSTESNRACVDPADINPLNHTFQIYDPVSHPDQPFVTIDLIAKPCIGGQYDPLDQRPTLGAERPRLHSVSWMSRYGLHYRAMSAGPSAKVYLLDAASPDKGWLEAKGTLKALTAPSFP